MCDEKTLIEIMTVIQKNGGDKLKKMILKKKLVLILLTLKDIYQNS